MTHVQRLSTLLFKTLREDPADAETASHRLLVRAGYVRRTSAGVWTWLPLGKRVLDNVARVVREEMDAIGGQEVLLPALLPKEPYEASGRWKEYGDLLFRLRDRKGAEYLLGPTHEEVFALTVKDQCTSYKDLPVILYQVQNKYRDEARPRSGVLRGREFLMKDAYSFDVTDEGLAESYRLHRQAYARIFERLGLDHRIVSAVSGAMGGSASEEFLAPAAAGEDTFADCPRCDYAANTEAVTVAVEPVVADGVPAPRELDTPGTPTIEALAAHLDVPASAILKNVLVKVDGEIVAVGVPGDREVDLGRLAEHLAPAEVELVTADDFAGRPELVRGYVGPQGLDVPYFADPRVAPGTAWITGANKPDAHVRDVVCGRDFTVGRYLDAVVVEPGDPCPRCGAGLEIGRAIEIGHIFQLGRKYADAFGLDVLGPEGKPVRVTMGSYGIGVSRAVAALAEQTHDERGLCWPREVAPADVHVVAAGKAGQVLELALDVAALLADAGVRVLVDDRTGVSAGVKFADAELIGVPLLLIVGRGAAEGRVELKDRRSGERWDVTVEEAVARLTAD
ncbi:proline--tRNA ligase [Streptomyces sp. AV19]|uniref:proline--tRNA ligase n=1 Tax=Streptomyces sp. AV19 TaxID=2793068 RepID=UPI0018FE6EC4|nr:proline--tRNA ligase [Streptomyces sp. AV19]MBH1934049.1 proline--tRNA ligase [Streptomyces sp. AV19]MDG4535470.1 proline--tRNA ligase [Streptomyces sp. AV19]